MQRDGALAASAFEPPSEEDELSLLARASWLYFSGGMTHGEVADRLHIPAFKVQRLIARATRDGLIHVFVNSPVAKCVRLEHELCSRYGLRECVVAPDLGETGLPLKSLAPAGASFLLRIIQQDAHRIIGLGHGRTLTAIVDHLPQTPAPQMSFVALLGGLTTSFSADPYDVIHGVSHRTGAAGYFIPAPFFANSATDRAVLLSQLGVTHAIELARKATLCIVGIGTATADGFLAKNGSLGPEDLTALNRLGARSEILCYFHDENGKLVNTELSARCVTLPYDELADRGIIAAAGGPDKVDAIRSVLKSGLLRGLITDEATAVKLAGEATPHVSVMKPRSNRKREISAPKAASAGGRRMRAPSHPAATSKDKR
jgi:DNA-binding transcriptional regulator LsrR (DeoR family)